MKSISAIFLIFILINVKAFPQVFEQSLESLILDIDTLNYVKNPSFEEYTECPSTLDGLNKCKHWRRIIDVVDSPNYFHRCANKYIGYYEITAGVPRNAFGYQEPRTGDGYAGICTFGKDYYKEYINTKLKLPLKEGVVYKIGMYVSLSNKSKYANDRFTFCLTKKPELEIRSRRYKGVTSHHIICPNGILYKSDTLITDTINWVNIEVEYTAMGGEEFLTIGVFDGDISWWERRKKRRNVFNEKFKHKVPGAHYYIDDVYVIQKEDYLKMKEYDEVE